VGYICGASAFLIVGLPLLGEWMIRRDLRKQIQGEPVHPNYRRYLRYHAQPKAISSIYTVGWWIAFVPVFLGSWVYCIAKYGYLFGVGLGWLPSLIVGVIAAYLWPAILVLTFAATFAITR